MLSGFVGLRKDQVEAHRRRFGANVLEKPSNQPWWRLIKNQFTSPLMLILMGALGLTLLLGDYVDAMVIFLSISVNSCLGFWQEFKAEQALQALHAIVTLKTTVIRESRYTEIPVADVVPHDLVYLATGERIPADGVLIESKSIRVNEAVLTGEARAVEKRHTKLPLHQVSQEFVGLEARQHKGGMSSVYAGTTVMDGEGIMLVLRTGMHTEVGNIAEKLTKTEEGQTPLQRKLAVLGKRISWLVMGVAVALLMLGWYKGMPLLEMLMMAVAVAVAAVPEGLAISLTAILAVGMQRILKRKALVRKLLAAEVLGSVSVICTDKTGTLTEGNLRVDKVRTQEKERMLKAAWVATVGIDPVEIAWREWAEATTGVVWGETCQQSEKVLDRLSFSSEKRYSVTLSETGIWVVGAPEVVMGLSSLSYEKKKQEMNLITTHAQDGYRIIAVAFRNRQGEEKITPTLLQKPYYWLGTVMYADKLRDGLLQVFKEVDEAGIAVKVITGDYGETALSMLKKIKFTVAPHEHLDGEELARLPADVLAARVKTVKLFSRTSPSQKLLIVNALQEAGEVVAMTGDGINDAPALKRADIGIVVANASEVAKETADMVLLDSNFATIVAAIEEGRGIYKNLKKVLLYLMSDSLSQVLLVMLALLLGMPLPLITAQVLWVNLISDSLPALALTVDPHIWDLMNKPPRKPEEALIDREMGMLMGLISLVTAGVVFGMYAYLLAVGIALPVARTYAFSLLVVVCLMYVFSSRSLHTPLWKDKPGRNPWLIVAVVVGLLLQVMAVYIKPFQELLKTTALPFSYWISMFFLALFVMAFMEMTKLYYGRKLARE